MVEELKEVKNVESTEQVVSETTLNSTTKVNGAVGKPTLTSSASKITLNGAVGLPTLNVDFVDRKDQTEFIDLELKNKLPSNMKYTGKQIKDKCAEEEEKLETYRLNLSSDEESIEQENKYEVLLRNKTEICSPFPCLNHKEFSNVKIKQTSNDYEHEFTYFPFVFEIVNTIVHNTYGHNVVTHSEKPGDVIVLPKRISSKIYAGAKQFYNIRWHPHGWYDGTYATDYDMTHEYNVLFETDNFIVCHVEARRDFFVQRLKQGWWRFLHELTFGFKEIKPYVMYNNIGNTVVWNAGNSSVVQGIVRRTAAQLGVATDAGASPDTSCWLPYELVNAIKANAMLAIDSTFLQKKLKSEICRVLKQNNDILPHYLTAFKIAACTLIQYEFEGATRSIEKGTNVFGVKYGVESTKNDFKLKDKAHLDEVACDAPPQVEDKPAAYVMFPCRHDEVYYPADTINNAKSAMERQLKDCNTPLPENVHGLSQLWHNIKHTLMPIQNTKVMSYQSYFNHLRTDQQNFYKNGKFDEVLAISEYDITHKRVSAFIKREPHFKQDFVPRFISGCTPSCNMLLGKYIYSSAQILKNLWNPDPKGVMCDIIGNTDFCSNFIMCMGLNRDDIGDIIADVTRNFIRPVCLSTDYSRFDSHIAADLLSIEHDIYLHMFPDDDNLRKLLDQQLHSKGAIQSFRQQYRIAYDVEGSRGSGFQNTAIGNCILNALLQLDCMNKQFDVMKAITEGKIKMLFMGDDTVIIMDDMFFDVDKYDCDMYKNGMEVKAELTDIAHVKFLSGRLVPCKKVINGKPDVDTYVHMPLMGKCIQKAGLTIHEYTKKETRSSWIWQNALAYRQMYRMIPFMHKWFDGLYKDHHNDKKIKLKERCLSTQYQYAYSGATAQWLSDVYHFDDTDIEYLCDVFSDWKNINFNHYYIDTIIESDMGEQPLMDVTDCTPAWQLYPPVKLVPIELIHRPVSFADSVVISVTEMKDEEKEYSVSDCNISAAANKIDVLDQSKTATTLAVKKKKKNKQRQNKNRRERNSDASDEKSDSINSSYVAPELTPNDKYKLDINYILKRAMRQMPKTTDKKALYSINWPVYLHMRGVDLLNVDTWNSCEKEMHDDESVTPSELLLVKNMSKVARAVGLKNNKHFEDGGSFSDLDNNL
jgi:hypothetical protein